MTPTIKTIVLWIVGGLGLTLEVVDHVHALEFLKESAPQLYGVLTNPITGAVLLLVAVLVDAEKVWKRGGEGDSLTDRPVEQKIENDNTSVGNQKVQNSQGAITAGRDVVYVAPPTQTQPALGPPGVAPKKKEEPILIQRGIVERQCVLPLLR